VAVRETGRQRMNTDRLRGRAVVRDPEEVARAASSLELLFDLTFVVAVNQASAGLAGELLDGKVADGVIGFTMVFFAVWWAWMNFTWFSSAHDADDVPHRLLVLVQMTGVLVLAAGVPSAFTDRSQVTVTIGYAIMRLGLVAGWLRVARSVPGSQQRALRYAAGISGLQVLWIARLALPASLDVPSFAVLAVGELLVPMWAERTIDRPMYNAGHIEDRYNLFTLIVLGESILSASLGFQDAVGEAGLTARLLAVGLGGLVLAFSAWWLYFDHPGHLTPTPDIAFRWGYAHVAVFAALAAMGAGIHVAADTVARGGDDRVAALAVAVPVAGFLAGLALVMALTRTRLTNPRIASKLVGAAVIIAAGAVLPPAAAVVAAALVMAVLVVAMVLVEPG